MLLPGQKKLKPPSKKVTNAIINLLIEIIFTLSATALRKEFFNEGLVNRSFVPIFVLQMIIITHTIITIKHSGTREG